jgi:hypothetical protein
MVVSVNVCTFQWYFTGPMSFGGILRRSRSFGVTEPIFPCPITGEVKFPKKKGTWVIRSFSQKKEERPASTLLLPWKETLPSDAEIPQTMRIGAFIRLLEETDKVLSAAAVSSRETSKSRRPSISFRSMGGRDSRERTSDGAHGGPLAFCAGSRKGEGDGVARWGARRRLARGEKHRRRARSWGGSGGRRR